MFKPFSWDNYSDKEQFLKICNEIIDSADLAYPTYPSCKEDIMPLINKMANDLTPKQWKTIPDIERSAYSIVFNIAFDVAVSGKYHLGYGVVNPISPMLQLKTLVYRCLNYAYQHGEISEEEKEQQHNNFIYGISHAG